MDVALVDRWVWVCGIAAILAALPTVSWRVLVGLGLTLGTLGSWRQSEALPGAGTSYVVALSAIQLTAALLTMVLFIPNVDRVPRWSPVAPSRRMPMSAVVGCGLIGAILVLTLCVLSVAHWGQVDPLGDARTVSGWSYLCWSCYLIVPAWPVLLIATSIEYWKARRRTSTEPRPA